MANGRLHLLTSIDGFVYATGPEDAIVECTRCPANWVIRHRNEWVANGHARRLRNHAARHGKAAS